MFGGSEKNRVGSEKKKTFYLSAAKLLFSPRLRFLFQTRHRCRLDLLFCLLPRPRLLHLRCRPLRWLCRRIRRTSYQTRWDFVPCSINPPQHHFFAGRSLLSRWCVGKRAVDHPSFVLRTDLCFKWLIDSLIQWLQHRS